MPLSMTKVAYEAKSLDEILDWFSGDEPEKRLTTRYLPKRHAEMIDGSLYWIHQHALVGRSPILGFEQRDDVRWWIVLEIRLILVQPRARRYPHVLTHLDVADRPASTS